MMRLAVWVMIGLAMILPCVPSATAAIPNGFINDEGFTWLNGSWWRGGLSYSRTRSSASCGARWVYRRSVTSANGANTINNIINANNAVQAPVGWKGKLLAIAAKEKENQYFVESLRQLGYGNVGGRQSYQLSSAGVQGNTVYGYNYNTVASLYGDANPALLYQQAARLTQNAQGLAGQATNDFNALVGKDASLRAEVASILAAGQAVREARSGVRIQTSSTVTGSVPTQYPDTRPDVPADPPIRRDATPAPARSGEMPSSGGCASCHSKGKEAEGKGFVLVGRKLSPLDLISVMKRIRDGSMPPKGNKYNHPHLTDEQAADWLDWVESEAKTIK